jgi:hypothetical protein
MACHVTVAGVTKGAVAAAALAGGPVATAEVAFARAAELFGLRAPLPSGATAWVPCDPETFVPLHLPEVEIDPGAVPVDAPARSALDESATAARAGGAPPEPVATHVGGGAPEPATVAARDGAPVAEKPTGQQMIDRLVDRLKEEGQGLAAARLLVRYGGYGKDPDTARELYAQLRVLLRGEAAAGPAGGGSA